MKLIYISLSIATSYLIFFKFKATYDGNHDSMRAEFLIVPAAGLAVLINNDFSAGVTLSRFFGRLNKKKRFCSVRFAFSIRKAHSV